MCVVRKLRPCTSVHELGFQQTSRQLRQQVSVLAVMAVPVYASSVSQQHEDRAEQSLTKGMVDQSLLGVTYAAVLRGPVQQQEVQNRSSRNIWIVQDGTQANAGICEYGRAS